MNYGRYENRSLSNMGRPNADLSSRGCTAHLRRRLQTGRNSRQKNNPESTLGNRNTNDDSDPHGLPIPYLELSCESLGKHHRSSSFSCFNLLGVPTYRSAYDRFLIIVGVGLNVL